jgi:diadenosine tetraphosphate (Ap4A) HIT family hydrolase
MDGCVFCSVANAPSSKRVAENEHFVAVPDLYPVSKGHTLLISKKHYDNIFSLPPDETASLQEILVKVKGALDAAYSPAGFNVTSNIGKAAGQTVFHLHVHVIPRYSGDTLKLEAGGPRKSVV